MLIGGASVCSPVFIRHLERLDEAPLAAHSRTDSPRVEAGFLISARLQLRPTVDSGAEMSTNKLAIQLASLAISMLLNQVTELNEFQCEPKLVDSFMSGGIINNNNTDTDLQENNAPPLPVYKGTIMNTDDKSQQHVDRPPAATISLAKQHYMKHEVIELTCAVQLNDELDLDLIQVDWWHLEATGRWALVWRSGELNEESHDSGAGGGGKARQQTATTPSVSATTLAKSSEYSIIDYVTRANGTIGKLQATRMAGKDNREGASSSHLNEKRGAQRASVIGQDDQFNFARDKDDADSETAMKLIRVVHLIAIEADSNEQPLSGSNSNSNSAFKDQQQQQQPLDRHFLCRITNKIGRVDVVYPLQVGLESRRAQRDSRQRQELRRMLSDQPKWSSLAYWLTTSAPSDSFEPSPTNKRPSWSMERVRAAIEHESLAVDNSTYRRRPLFIPVHLPEDLLDGVFDNSLDQFQVQPASPDDTSEGSSSSSAARSLNLNANRQLPDHQRPATRGTNTSMSRVTTSAKMQTMPSASDRRTSGHSSSDYTSLDTINDFAENVNDSSRKVARRKLRSIALNLIARYTSNMKTLIEPIDLETTPGDIEGFANDRSIVAHLRPAQVTPRLLDGSESFGALLRQLYKRHLDRKMQPLMLGALVGILFGCVVALMIKVSLNRCRRGNRRRRVGDLQDNEKSIEGSSQEEKTSNERLQERDKTVENQDLECVCETEQSLIDAKEDPTPDILPADGVFQKEGDNWLALYELPPLLNGFDLVASQVSQSSTDEVSIIDFGQLGCAYFAASPSNCLIEPHRPVSYELQSSSTDTGH